MKKTENRPQEAACRVCKEETRAFSRHLHCEYCDTMTLLRHVESFIYNVDFRMDGTFESLDEKQIYQCDECKRIVTTRE